MAHTSPLVDPRVNAAPTSPDERVLVAALRTRDEASFRKLTTELYGSMMRVAGIYCPSNAVCQEIIQETWVAVLEGLGRFEFRSSLKTWIFRILANRARTRAVRERRTVSLDALIANDGEHAVDPSRFDDRGMWSTPPRHFDPERAKSDGEFVAALSIALDELPPAQRAVVVMRDMEDLSTLEVAEALEISEIHVRVLLHRARSRLRAKLEADFGEAT